MKILIIGLGSIALKHIEALRILNPESLLFALRSNKNNATENNEIINLYLFDEVKNIDFDFAIISNPTIKHKETIESLIPLRIPLFIEKPVHSSLEIATTLPTIEENNILTYVGCNLRFLDSLKFIKEYLNENPHKKINEVNVYCGSYLPNWRPDKDFRVIYSANAEQGGGVHLDLIHELDYIYWFFGMPKKIRRYFTSKSSLNISAIDYANYLFDYEGFCVNIILNYYRNDAKRTLELVFEDETWNADLLQNTIKSNNMIIFTSEQRMKDTYVSQMKYFLNILKNKEKSFNTLKDGYKVLTMCLGNDTER